MSADRLQPPRALGCGLVAGAVLVSGGLGALVAAVLRGVWSW